MNSAASGGSSVKRGVKSQMSVAHDSNSSYLGGRNQEDVVQGQPGQKERPYVKNTQHKKGRVAQPVECMPSKQ
jgi:hypothetical protein